MKLIRTHRIALGTAAVALVLGGSLLGAGSAFAASGTGTAGNSTSGISAPPAPGTHWHGHHGMMGFWLFKQVAKDLNVTPKVLMTDLRSGQSLVQVAASKGVAQSQLQTDLQTIVHTQLEKAVTAGRMTAAQETTKEQTIDAKLSAWASAVHTMPMPPLLGHGPKPMHGFRVGLITEVASLLHLTPSTVMADLKSGQSFDQIAIASGTSQTTFTQEIEAYITQKVDAMVPTLLSKSHKAPQG